MTTKRTGKKAAADNRKAIGARKPLRTGVRAGLGASFAASFGASFTASFR